ncbi:MAG: AMP-binding protein [Proteobacteria bacterium]|nr:AMP-binding protein [Pseudomonadota bacterium]
MRVEVVLAAHAERQPDKTAVICGGKAITYGALQHAIRQVAGGLADLGLGPDDKIVLYLPNGMEVVQLLYAALTLGAVAVPVTTRMTVHELADFCADCEARVLAFHSAQADALGDLLAARQGMASVVVGGDVSGAVSFATLLQDRPGDLPAVPAAQDECMINYTSGTTGRAKGAIITHANVLIQNGFIHPVEWRLTSDDCFLVGTPLAHRTGMGRLANALTLGATIVVMESFSAAKAVDLIEAHGVTVMGMVPTVCRMMLPEIAADPSRCRSLRRVLVTGEAFPVTLKQQFIELLPGTKLVSFFAMTEAGGVTSLSHEEQFTHPASVGRPTPGIEVRVVDDAGRDMATGEVGELLVRSGPPGAFTVMKGYLNRAEETAAALRDGWFYTGDLGYRDRNGYLYIADRKKDMILSGGFNIYSKEVEGALISHAEVADAAVIGVADEIYGEAVAAFVEPAAGTRPSAEVLITHCRTMIASYKKPKYVVFLEALPRNAVGKVLKRELAALAPESLQPLMKKA